MKKNFSRVMLVAAAAIAFFACQKQEINAPEEVTNVTLSFSSEKPSFDDETKTQWNGSSIVWSAGDKISVAYTVEGEWMGYMPEESTTASAPRLYKSDPLEASSPTAKFNVSDNFNIKAEGTHVFYGVYPAISSTLFDDAPVATVTIPSIQTPEASSFDSSADLMTGVSVGEFNSLPKPEDEISMMWTRLVAHANITLKSVNGIATDEKIFSITLTAQDDANLVGKQKVNLLKNDEVNKAVASAKTNQVQINGGNLSVANGDVEFWACILPATLTSLKVEVDTDKATYTREIKNISKTFKQNARNTLSIKMDGATRVEKAAETWRLVKSSETLSEGTYVLVVKNTNTNNYTGALDSSNGSSSSPALNTSVKVNGDVLESVDPKVQFDLEIVNEGYKFAVAGQTTNYLYTTTSNSGVRIGTNTNNVWTLSKDADHPDAYTFKCNATARYLGVYEANAEWRCYTSINDNIKDRNSEVYLYKKTSGAVAPDTTPKLEVDESEIELTSDGGEGTVAVTASNVYSLQVRALAKAGSQVEVTWLSVEYDENGTLSYAAEANGSENSREAYIEIYAEDLEGTPLTKYIHVTQDGKSEGGATEPVDVTISFATTAQRTSQTTSQQVWTNGGVVLTNNKSESQNDVVDSSNPVKFYASSQIIITAPGNISQIVFDCNTADYATSLKNSISGASVAVSSKKVTITLNGSSDTFTIAKLSAQVRADAVTVTYLGEATGGETPDPEQPALTPRNLAFSSATATATVGQASFDAPTLSGITTGVTYSSSNTNVATVNNSGVVTIVAAGTTTIKASALATDQYEAGDASYTLTVSAAPSSGTKKTFTIKSDDIVSNNGYQAYTTTVDGRSWVITCGGNNKSVGVNSSNRSKCNLANTNYTKYAVSPITTSSTASAFASTTQLMNVSKISYAKLSGGSNHASTKIYILYSPDGTTFSQISLTSGTQGATINTSSGGTFEFAECSGYFAVVFAATNNSGNWRLDDVNLTFTYTE